MEDGPPEAFDLDPADLDALGTFNRDDIATDPVRRDDIADLDVRGPFREGGQPAPVKRLERDIVVADTITDDVLHNPASGCLAARRFVEPGALEPGVLNRNPIALRRLDLDILDREVLRTIDLDREIGASCAGAGSACANPSPARSGPWRLPRRRDYLDKDEGSGPTRSRQSLA